jgi:hypothetical protein
MTYIVEYKILQLKCYRFFEYDIRDNHLVVAHRKAVRIGKECNALGKSMPIMPNNKNYNVNKESLEMTKNR